MFKKIFCLVVVLLVGSMVFGLVPGTINFQGVLKDSAGGLVTNTKSMTFSLYDVASGGTAIWTETQMVTVEGGLYNIQLGASSQLSAGIFSGGTYYLGVKVESDAEMTPRVVLVSVPYAYRASLADAISGGIGSYAAFGTSEVQSTDTKYGIAVKKTGSTVGYAVYANATSEGTNFHCGVFASGGGQNGMGVYAYSPNNTAVYGWSDKGVGVVANGSTAGGSFTATGNTGAAIDAIATHTTGINYGVDATTFSSNGYAIHGNANASTGANYGVYGITLSSGGYGVYGFANNSGGGYGVYGLSYANSGYAMYGKGTSNGVAVAVDTLLYLIPRSGAPTGDVLQEGLMYYNSGDHSLRIYTGQGASGWEKIATVTVP